MSGLPKTLFTTVSPMIGLVLPCLALQVGPMMQSSFSTAPNASLLQSAVTGGTELANGSTCNDGNVQDVYCYRIMDFTAQATIVNTATLHMTPQLINDSQSELQVGTWQGTSWEAA